MATTEREIAPAGARLSDTEHCLTDEMFLMFTILCRTRTKRRSKAQPTSLLLLAAILVHLRHAAEAYIRHHFAITPSCKGLLAMKDKGHKKLYRMDWFGRRFFCQHARINLARREKAQAKTKAQREQKRLSREAKNKYLTE